MKSMLLVLLLSCVTTQSKAYEDYADFVTLMDQITARPQVQRELRSRIQEAQLSSYQCSKTISFAEWENPSRQRFIFNMMVICWDQSMKRAQVRVEGYLPVRPFDQRFGAYVISQIH